MPAWCSPAGEDGSDFTGVLCLPLRRANAPTARLSSTRISGSSRVCTENLNPNAGYYNLIRTHQSLDKDAPVSRPVQRIGSINSHAILSGLHHHYGIRQN